MKTNPYLKNPEARKLMAINALKTFDSFNDRLRSDEYYSQLYDAVMEGKLDG